MEMVTWNPLDKEASVVLSADKLTASNVFFNKGVRATRFVSSGKWYWEINVVSGNYAQIGILPDTTTTADLSTNLNTFIQTLGGVMESGGGTNFTTPATIGVALDMDNLTIKTYLNGSTTPMRSVSIPIGNYAPVVSETGNVTHSFTANFGNTPFKYAITSGFSPLDVEGFHSRIKSSLADMQIGDVIPCRYTATSGAFGMFSELGTTTATEIPVASSATPDGLFYFIMVGYDLRGRKKLVADRNIQQSISWDALNTVGIASGEGLPTKFYEQLSIIPIMTSNTSPSGIASASSMTSTSNDAYKAFDVDNTASGWVANGITGWLQYKFDVPKIVTNYSINPHPSTITSCPKSWTFEGSNDGTTWTILDTQINVNGWINYYKKFEFQNNNPFLYYRINITANNGDTQYLRIFSLKMCESDMPFGDYNFTTRLLSGGTSATDKDNEWDKIIVESTLGGKITAGDGSVWNWNTQYSLTSTTPTTGNTVKTSRGSTAVGRTDYTMTTSGVSASVGFRPVLLVEQQITLFQFVRDLKGIFTLKFGFYSLGNTLESSQLETYGVNDLSLLTTEMTSNVIPTTNKGVLGGGTLYESFQMDLSNADLIEYIDGNNPTINCTMREGYRLIDSLDNEFDIMTYVM